MAHAQAETSSGQDETVFARVPIQPCSYSLSTFTPIDTMIANSGLKVTFSTNTPVFDETVECGEFYNVPSGYTHVEVVFTAGVRYTVYPTVQLLGENQELSRLEIHGPPGGSTRAEFTVQGSVDQNAGPISPPKPLLQVVETVATGFVALENIAIYDLEVFGGLSSGGGPDCTAVENVGTTPALFSPLFDISLVPESPSVRIDVVNVYCNDIMSFSPGACINVQAGTPSPRKTFFYLSLSAFSNISSPMGGAVFTRGMAEFHFFNNSAEDIYATELWAQNSDSSSGAVVFAELCDRVEMYYNEISNVQSSTFLYQTDSIWMGGAIGIANVDFFNLHDNDFSYITTSGRGVAGGVVFVQVARIVQISRNKFSSYLAQTWSDPPYDGQTLRGAGGAIYVEVAEYVVINDCEFVDGGTAVQMPTLPLPGPWFSTCVRTYNSAQTQDLAATFSYDTDAGLPMFGGSICLRQAGSVLDPIVQNNIFLRTVGVSYNGSSFFPSEIFGTVIAVDQSGAEIVGNNILDGARGWRPTVEHVVYSPIAIVSPNVITGVVVEANQFLGNPNAFSNANWDYSKGVVHVEGLAPTAVQTDLPLKITANHMENVVGAGVYSVVRFSSALPIFSYIQLASNLISGNDFVSYGVSRVGILPDTVTEQKLYCNTVAVNQFASHLLNGDYPMRLFSNLLFQNVYADDAMDPSSSVSYGYNIWDTIDLGWMIPPDVQIDLDPSEFSDLDFYILDPSSEFAGYSTPSVYGSHNLNNCVTTFLDAGPRNIYFLTPGAHDVSVPTCASNFIDFDSDSICDLEGLDNCFLEANPLQENADLDDVGDSCDPDPLCFANTNCELTTSGFLCDKEVPPDSPFSRHSILVDIIPPRNTVGVRQFFTTDSLQFTCVAPDECASNYSEYTAGRSVAVEDSIGVTSASCASGVCGGDTNGDPPDISLDLWTPGLSLGSHTVSCTVYAYDLETPSIMPAESFIFTIDEPPIVIDAMSYAPTWDTSASALLTIISLTPSPNYSCGELIVTVLSCTGSIASECGSCVDNITTTVVSPSIIRLGWQGNPPESGCGNPLTIELHYLWGECVNARRAPLGVPYGVAADPIIVDTVISQIELSVNSGAPTTFLPTADLVIPATLIDPNNCPTNADDVTMTVDCDDAMAPGCGCSSAQLESSFSDLVNNGEIVISVPSDTPELGCTLYFTVWMSMGCDNGWQGDSRMQDGVTLNVVVEEEELTLSVATNDVDWYPEEDLLIPVIISDPNDCAAGGQPAEVLVGCSSNEVGCGCDDVQGGLQESPDSLGNAIVQVEFTSQNYPNNLCEIEITMVYRQPCGAYGSFLSTEASVRATILLFGFVIVENPNTWNVATGPLAIPVLVDSANCGSGTESVDVVCGSTTNCDCNLQSEYNAQGGEVVLTALAPFPQTGCSLDLTLQYSKECLGVLKTASDSTAVTVVLDAVSVVILGNNGPLEWTPTSSSLEIDLQLVDPNGCPESQVVTATCDPVGDSSSCACSIGGTSLANNDNNEVYTLSLTIGNDVPSDGCLVTITTTYTEPCSSYSAEPLVATDSVTVAIILPELQFVLLNGEQVLWNPLQVLPVSYELLVPDECSGSRTVSTQCSALSNCECTIASATQVGNSILDLTLEAPFPPVGCDLTITISWEQQDCYQGSSMVAIESFVATVINDTPLPLPVFDSAYSLACTAHSSDRGFFIRLNPPSGPGASEIESYTWSTLPIYQCNPEDFNCGGRAQDNFIFIPPDSLEACVAFTATVVQNPVPNSGFIASQATTCAIIPRPPPTIGNCIAIRNSFPNDLGTGCIANNGDFFVLQCEDFQAQSCTNAGVGDLNFAVEQRIGATSSTEWLPKADVTDLGGGSFSMELGAPRVLRVRATDVETGASVVSNEVDVRICYETEEDTLAYISGSLLQSQELLEQGNVNQASSLALEASLALQEIEDVEEQVQQASMVQESIEEIVNVLEVTEEAVDTSEAIAALGSTAFAVCDEDNAEILLKLVDNDASEYNTAVAATSLGAAAIACSETGTSGELLNTVLEAQDNIRARVASDASTCETPSALLSGTDGYNYVVYAASGEDFQDGATFRVENVTFSFPPCFARELEIILQSTFEDPDLRLSSVSCVTVHTALYDVVCEDACPVALVSDLASFDFFVLLPGEEDASLVEVGNLPADCGFLLNLPRDESLKASLDRESRVMSDSAARFVLSADGESETELACGYQVPGEGFTFEFDGCQLVNATALTVTCECFHLSNFGALFDSGSSNDDWTAIRIASLAMLFSTWLILLVFFLLVTFWPAFAIFFDFETTAEKNRRILGDHVEDPS
eukprot:CAMPEP_0119125974 /NCGR_PEP_ID=MMETSP1310-20130426/5064_1 /TAXON_ID=464262 /ORGANISM="Genus nov. species nov., Strain RCC2339" /LENGTH=2319 /DNA_ID=CAMNT_0007116095 /DNA_START=230 /DNA_END=7189 /DNA_ORIENTATION=+